MKYADVSIQTVIILVTLIVLIPSFESGNWLTMILTAQLFMGAWQLSSSAIAVLVKAPFHAAKRWHLFLSVIHLLVLCAVGFESLLMLIVPSWILSFSYYAITWKWVLYRKKKRSRFLPNVGF